NDPNSDAVFRKSIPLHDQLPETHAGLRFVLHQGGQLQLGAREDERSRHRVRDRNGAAAMARRAPLVEARPYVTTEPAYVVAYNALLSDAATAADCAETLAEGQREGGAMWGDRPLCVSLRPNLVTKRQHAAN